MEARVNPLGSPYDNIQEGEVAAPSLHIHPHHGEYYGGDADPYEPDTVLQQQWVTLTAGMLPPATEPSQALSARDRLPLLAAVFCGAAFVVCLAAALLLYRCCVMPRRDKHYCLRKTDGSSHPSRSQLPPAAPSAVYAEQKPGGWGYTNRLVTCSPHYASQHQCPPPAAPVPRSSSVPGPSQQERTNHVNSTRRPRPVSQPIQFLPTNGDIVPKHMPMPDISEFSPQGVQYASSSILDEVCIKDELPVQGEASLKTRSLPAWVRSKPRPLSTEDDLNNLYAKVNFSKKRKNRMRNDEAAIIALSKSRSQFLHKDTDSLVDNEAVIVYDERTAL